MSVCKICGKKLKNPNLSIGPECQENYTKSKGYKYARDSVISNQGEDIKDSARHRYHEWFGLEKAEIAGDDVARREVTRDKLLKNIPPQIKATKENIVGASVATTILKRMPNEPIYVNDPTLKYEYFGLFVKNKEGKESIVMTGTNESRLQRYVKNKERESVRSLGNSAEANKLIRESYYNKYEWLRNEAEQISRSEALLNIQDNGAGAIIAINKEVQAFKDKYNKEFGLESYTWSDGRIAYTLGEGDSNYIDRYFNNFDSQYGRAKKYSLRDVVNNTLDSIKKGEIDSLVKSIEKANAGGSLGIGAEKGAKGVRFNPIIFYSQVLERTGPEIKEKTVNDFLDTINNKWKMRGIQFGNTMSDKERIEHLSRFCESMYDLKDVLGLTDDEMSLNSNLALAFGARGTTSALAHYEPKLKVINLTRKNGIGALAHEWGHAMEDNQYFTKSTSDKGIGLSIGSIFEEKKHEKYFADAHAQKIRTGGDTEFLEIQKGFSKEMHTFASRMVSSSLYEESPQNVREYLSNPKELFARTFEAMIKRKLEKKGRKNTYLVSCPTESDAYPTEVELAAMEPYFDKIVKNLFKSKPLSQIKIGA